MAINGTKIPLNKVNFHNHRLYIGHELLEPNIVNTVEIKFTNSYVNNSAGFHRSVDAKDGNVYIYSHLEPYNCHRWFPCFDQPSIRAPLKLSVITPEDDWQVIGNGKKISAFPLS